jgi:hypothetical protein
MRQELAKRESNVPDSQPIDVLEAFAKRAGLSLHKSKLSEAFREALRIPKG